MDKLKNIMNENPENTIIVFDIDGTLVGNKETIIDGKKTVVKDFPEDAVEAIKCLQELGFKCGINTGRSLESSVQTTVLDKGIAWDYAICSNGQTIINGNGEIIQKNLIEQDAINEIVKRAQEHNIGIIMDTEEGFVNIGKLTEQQKLDLGKTEYKEKRLEDVKECRCFSLVNGGGYNEQEMFDIFNDIPGIKINFSSRFYFDIVREGDSKAIAAKKFANLNNAENIIAFGDEKNDIEMAKGCDYFICMGSGNNEVKELADHVTTNWNDKGIWNATILLGKNMEKFPEIKTETLFNVKTIFEEKVFNNEEMAKEYLKDNSHDFSELNISITSTRGDSVFHTEMNFQSLEAANAFLNRNNDYQYINMVVRPNESLTKEKIETIDRTSELWQSFSNEDYKGPTR